MRTTLLLLLLCYLSIGYAQEKAADFTLKNTKDEEVSLSSFSGKVIVLEWFTTWCTKCREAFPELKPFLNKINREYAEKGVVVMAINLDKKEPEKVKAFAEKKGMDTKRTIPFKCICADAIYLLTTTGVAKLFLSPDVTRMI